MLNAARSPDLLTPKGIEDTEEERDGGGESHKGVHIGTAMTQLCPRGAVELTTTIEHPGSGEDNENEVAHQCTAHRMPQHRNGHDGNSKEPGTDGAAAQGEVGFAFDVVGVTVRFDDKILADSSHFALHVGKGDDIRVVLYKRRASR